MPRAPATKIQLDDMPDSRPASMFWRHSLLDCRGLGCLARMLAAIAIRWTGGLRLRRSPCGQALPFRRDFYYLEPRLCLGYSVQSPCLSGGGASLEFTGSYRKAGGFPHGGRRSR